jgi:endonuclease III
VIERLAERYPGDAAGLCALDHGSPFQLLVATILSAQCTDERVNQVTPEVFRRYPTALDMSGAPPGELEELIRPTGFYNNKARSLRGMSTALVERFGGEVPVEMEDLTALPGVGRKTANVVRSVAMGAPGLPVDTHVGRVCRRLGLTAATDPVAAERELNALVPPEERGVFSLRVILHGRQTCRARRPLCGECVLVDICPSADLPAAPARRRREHTRRAPA